MSTLPGLASKGEKSKSKYQSLDINSLYRVSRGENLGKQQQKNTLQYKHGMQSLGKVPSARRAPANLPSLKSEHSGSEASVPLVPPGAPGWGKQESTTPSTTPTSTSTNSVASGTTGGLATTNNQQVAAISHATQNSVLSSSGMCGGSPATSAITNSQIQSPIPANCLTPSSTSITHLSGCPILPDGGNIMAVPPSNSHMGGANAGNNKSWSAVMSGNNLSGHPPLYQSPQFQHEFPSLDGSRSTATDHHTSPSGATVGNSGVHTHFAIQQTPHYSPGLSLRPQTEGSWMQGGAVGVGGAGSGAGGVGGISGIGTGVASAITSSVNGPTRNNSGHMGPQPHLSGQAGPASNTQAHSAIPPHYRTVIPNFMFKDNLGGVGFTCIPPNQNVPQLNRSNTRQDGRLLQPRMIDIEEITPRPIIKQEELNRIDEMDKDMGWTAHDEIDYNQKLAFSDDEDIPSSRTNYATESSRDKDKQSSYNIVSNKELDKDVETTNLSVAISTMPTIQKDHSQKPASLEHTTQSNSSPTDSDIKSNHASTTAANWGHHHHPSSFSHKQQRTSEEEQWKQKSSQHKKVMEMTVLRAKQRKADEERRFSETTKQGAAKKLQELEQKMSKRKDEEKLGIINANTLADNKDIEHKEDENVKPSQNLTDKAFSTLARKNSNTDNPSAHSVNSSLNGPANYSRPFQSNVPPRFRKHQTGNMLTDFSSNEILTDDFQPKKGYGRQNSFDNKSRICNTNEPIYEASDWLSPADSSKKSEEILSWAMETDMHYGDLDKSPSPVRIQTARHIHSVPGPITKDRIEADDMKNDKRSLTQLKRGGSISKQANPDSNEGPDHRNVFPKSPPWSDLVAGNDPESSTSADSADAQKKSNAPKKAVEEPADVKQTSDKKSTGNRNRNSYSQQGKSYNDYGSRQSSNWPKRSERSSNRNNQRHYSSSDQASDQMNADEYFENRKDDKQNVNAEYVPRGEPSRRGRGGNSRNGRGGLSKRIDGYGPPPLKSPFGSNQQTCGLDNDKKTCNDESSNFSEDDKNKSKSRYDQQRHRQTTGKAADSECSLDDKIRKNNINKSRNNSSGSIRRNNGRDASTASQPIQRSNFGGHNKRDDSGECYAFEENEEFEGRHDGFQEVKGKKPVKSMKIDENKPPSSAISVSSLSSVSNVSLGRGPRSGDRDRKSKNSQPTQLTQEQISNIPSLMATPIQPPPSIANQSNKTSQSMDSLSSTGGSGNKPRSTNSSNKLLPPRFNKKKDSRQSGSQHAGTNNTASGQSGSNLPSTEGNTNNSDKVSSQNCCVYGIKETVQIGNAWETNKLRSSTVDNDVSGMSLGAIGSGFGSTNSDQPASTVAPTTSTVSTTAPGMSIGSISNKSILDGSTPPTNTIIFENTNFKSNSGPLKTGGLTDNTKKVTRTKIDESGTSVSTTLSSSTLDGIANSFSNNAVIGSEMLSIKEKQTTDKSSASSMTSALSFKEESDDMKLDFFDLTGDESGTTKNMTGCGGGNLSSSSVSSSMHAVQTAPLTATSCTASSLSTTDALNVKIQSVKKMWETPSDTHPQHQTTHSHYHHHPHVHSHHHHRDTESPFNNAFDTSSDTAVATSATHSTVTPLDTQITSNASNENDNVLVAYSSSASAGTSSGTASITKDTQSHQTSKNSMVVNSTHGSNGMNSAGQHIHASTHHQNTVPLSQSTLQQAPPPFHPQHGAATLVVPPNLMSLGHRHHPHATAPPPHLSAAHQHHTNHAMSSPPPPLPPSMLPHAASLMGTTSGVNISLNCGTNPPYAAVAQQQLSFQAAANQYGISAIPSPPAVLYNSTTQRLQQASASAVAAGLYSVGMIPLDQSSMDLLNANAANNVPNAPGVSGGGNSGSPLNANTGTGTLQTANQTNQSQTNVGLGSGNGSSSSVGNSGPRSQSTTPQYSPYGPVSGHHYALGQNTAGANYSSAAQSMYHLQSVGHHGAASHTGSVGGQSVGQAGPPTHSSQDMFQNLASYRLSALAAAGSATSGNSVPGATNNGGAPNAHSPFANATHQAQHLGQNANAGMLIPSSSNTLMPSAVKSTNQQQMSAIGTKTGGMNQAYQPQTQQNQMYMSYDLQGNYGVMQRNHSVQSNVPNMQSSSYYSNSGYGTGQGNFYQQPTNNSLQATATQLQHQQATYGLQNSVFSGQTNAAAAAAIAAAGLQNFNSHFLSTPILAALSQQQQQASAYRSLPSLQSQYMKNITSGVQQQMSSNSSTVCSSSNPMVTMSGTMDQTNLANNRSQHLKSPANTDNLCSVFSSGSPMGQKMRQNNNKQSIQSSVNSSNKYHSSSGYMNNNQSAHNMGRYPNPIQRPVNFQSNNMSNNSKHRNNNSNKGAFRQYYQGNSLPHSQTNQPVSNSTAGANDGSIKLVNEDGKVNDGISTAVVHSLNDVGSNSNPSSVTAVSSGSAAGSSSASTGTDTLPTTVPSASLKSMNSDTLTTIGEKVQRLTTAKVNEVGAASTGTNLITKD